MRIAVLGAGITGTCAALGLAERGASVDLYDRSDQVLAAASFWNEGKIHLGFVYAQDKSLATAQRMLDGALSFGGHLSRWVGKSVLDNALSDPFVYAVHRHTQVSPEGIEQHFRSVEDLYREQRAAAGAAYVRQFDGPLWEPLQRGEREALFNPDLIAAAYRTQEVCVDPWVVADALRGAVSTSPRLEPRMRTTVEGVREHDGGFTVDAVHAGDKVSEDYDAVVNVLWQNRLAIDATLGLHDARPVIHRFKAGLFSRSGYAPADVPTVTFVLGPYGDTVRYRDRSYLSWYPSGHLLTTTDRAPEDPPEKVLEEAADDVAERSLDALSELIPGAENSMRRQSASWALGGGYITAWGRTGIDDVRSRLHQRHEIGIASHGRYLSVDTGKYTLGPKLALEICDHLLPVAVSVRVSA